MLHPAMNPRRSRTLLAVALSAAVVLSVAVAAVFVLQRGSVEISVTDVNLGPGAPGNDTTVVHARLVLHNVGRAAAHFALFSLGASDTVIGTLSVPVALPERVVGPVE